MGCYQRRHCCERKSMKPENCQCHHQERTCNCQGKVHSEMKKDCVKIEWVVPEGGTQSVFQNGGFNQIIGSGFVSYDTGNAPYIIVRFFLDGVQQGADIPVFRDSSVAFTYTKFNQITVLCPSTGNVGQGNYAANHCAGELSIMARYPV